MYFFSFQVVYPYLIASTNAETVNKILDLEFLNLHLLEKDNQKQYFQSNLLTLFYVKLKVLKNLK